MGQWTKEQFKRHLSDQSAISARAKGGAGKGGAVVQKSQANDSAQPKSARKPKRKSVNDANHPAGGEGKDEVTGGRYRVRFILCVSNRQRRDGFGMSETIADCLVRAIGRFLEPNP